MKIVFYSGAPRSETKSRIDPRSWVLTGGEDHAFLATFGPGRTVPAGWLVIGTVGDGAVVTVTGVE